MGKKVVLQLPDALGLTEKEIVVMLAAHLYGDGHLSLGHAAEFAGMGKHAFALSIGKYGVSLFNAPVEDYLNDMKNAVDRYSGHK